MFNEGDITLVKNTEHMGYLKWHLPSVLKIYPGKDNTVKFGQSKIKMEFTKGQY